jgi:hypothetical protein
MKKKVYLIKKANISEGLIETDTEVYNTEQERDRAWHQLVHDHNEMIRDCYCDEHRYLEDIINSQDEYHYEFDDNHLEFWCKDDPEMHTDYYDKGEDTIAMNDRIFVVLIDSYDGEGSSIVDMELFGTLEAAKEHLKICVEDFKKDVTNWDDADIYTAEETDVSFTWFESGYYDQNHYCVDIYERTIHDGTIKLGGE